MNTKLKLFGYVHTTVGIFLLALLTQTMSAETLFTNEFWISTNTATANLGTLSDPYDGSTQTKFDSAMNNMPLNSTVHIMAGTYTTLGSDGWRIKTGQKIFGSGIDVTTLQFPPNAPNTISMIASPDDVPVTNIEVSDLTCDANYTAGANASYMGVAIWGTESAVRRVKVINLASFGSPWSEVWGISLSGGEVNGVVVECQGNIIEECEVSHFAGGPAISAMEIGGGSGIIRNNRIFLTPTNSAYQAFNGSWSHDVLIEGNYVNGTGNGVYCDTGGSTNLIIANNTFRNCDSGVAFSGAPHRNITIAFNNIMLASTAGAAFNLYNDSITNVVIIGNNIGLYSQGASSSIVIAGNNLTGVVFAHNMVDTNLAANQATTTYFVNTVNLSMYNNYDLSGNYLPSLNIPMIGNTPVTSFGLSLVGSAGASPALVALGLPGNPNVVVTNGSTQPVTFNTNVTVNGTLCYSNMVAQLVAGTGVTTSQVNTSTGRVVTVNANSQTNGFGNIVTHGISEFAASTNSTTWSSLSVTNAAATNWVTVSVTPSNAVISVLGKNVAILQTNGIFNAYNGLSTTVSNQLAAVTLYNGHSTFNWTNTFPENVVVYINGPFLSAAYNGSTILIGAVPPGGGSGTILMQQGSNIQINNNGSINYSVSWHPF